MNPRRTPTAMSMAEVEPPATASSSPMAVEIPAIDTCTSTTSSTATSGSASFSAGRRIPVKWALHLLRRRSYWFAYMVLALAYFVLICWWKSAIPWPAMNSSAVAKYQTGASIGDERLDRDTESSSSPSNAPVFPLVRVVHPASGLDSVLFTAMDRDVADSRRNAILFDSRLPTPQQRSLSIGNRTAPPPIYTREELLLDAAKETAAQGTPSRSFPAPPPPFPSRVPIQDRPLSSTRGFYEKLIAFTIPTKKWRYPQSSIRALRQVRGFRFCSHLNGAVFDSSARINADLVDSLIHLDPWAKPAEQKQKPVSERNRDPHGSPSQTSFSVENQRREFTMPRLFARMFSPTVDMRKIPFVFKSARSNTDQLAADLHHTAANATTVVSSGTAARGPKVLGTPTTIRRMGDKKFAALVDLVARLLYEYRTQHFLLRPLMKDHLSEFLRRMPVDKHAAKRFACYMAADGNNEWAQLTLDGRIKLLRFVDGTRYFEADLRYPPVNMTMVRLEAEQMSRGEMQEKRKSTVVSGRFEEERNPQLLLGNRFLTTPKSSQSKRSVGDMTKQTVAVATGAPSPLRPANETRPHRMVYFMMVHRGFEGIVALLDALLDPYVIVLVHVDARACTLKKQLTDHLAKQTNPLYQRIRIMRQSFTGVWGSTQLVQMQLAGFFELLALGEEWEYVMNISGNDYPLRYNDVIYEELKRKYNGKNLVEHWTSWFASFRVNLEPSFTSQTSEQGSLHSLGTPSFQSDTREAKRLYEAAALLEPKPLGSLSFPFPNWSLYKHHQWMILHRTFVQHLQQSPTATYVLATMEWASVPDEAYFADVGKNSVLFSDTIVPESRRFMEFFPLNCHPAWMQMGNLRAIRKAALEEGKMFVRKVDIAKERNGLIPALNALREETRLL